MHIKAVSTNLSTKPLTLFALFVCLISLQVPKTALASEPNANDTSAFTYVAHDNDEERLEQALTRATAQDKYLLVVLGAQWCHDSTGFAKKIQTPAMQLILEARYQTLFVDLGNYKDKRSIVERFNYPIFFGTPTVMIVDPVSERLLNLDSMTMFNTADSIEQAEYERYFSEFEASPETPNKAIKVDAQALATFEAEQSERLMRAYQILSPYMAQEDAGELEDKTTFYALWDEVRDYRFTLQQDIHDLRQGKRDEFPTYEAFSRE